MSNQTQDHDLRFRDVALIGAVMLAGLVLRIFKIDQPFVDRWSYRQSDVAMVARNFYQFGYDILLPQIDYGGTHPGYVGMEFPVVPFIAALFYHPFGEHEAIARVVSLVFFLLSVPPLYLLVEFAANKRSGFFAICLYSLMPLTIFCGRSFTSDMAANSLAIWAVWLFVRWTRDHTRTGLIAASFITSAAILTKAPYVAVGVPMAYLAIKNSGARAFVRPELWLLAAIALLPPLFWYYHAVEVTRSNYPNVAFLGHPDYFFVLLPIGRYLRILTNIVLWLTPAILFLTFAGLTTLKQKSDIWLFLWWCMGMALLILVASEDNYLQSWYQLPLTAPTAAFAGIGTDAIISRSSNLLGDRKMIGASVAIVLGFVAYQSLSFVADYYTPVAEPMRGAGKAVDRLVPSNALILFASWGDPTSVYYSKRHGWLFYEHLAAPTNAAEAIAMLEMRRHQGAGYFVITRLEDELRQPPYSSFWHYLETHFGKVCATPGFTIFDLSVAPADAEHRL